MSHIRTATGQCIFYDEFGSGPTTLLIPGQGGYRRGCFSWLADALAPRFRVVVLNNRDAGESTPETAYYTLGNMAGDAAALLDALGIDRAHVLGHSMGGGIALHLALDQPARLDRLVLISPAVRVEKPAGTDALGMVNAARTTLVGVSAAASSSSTRESPVELFALKT